MEKDNQLTNKVSFDFIRYANCWEDADILLEGLNAQPNKKIMSVASAGDNSFSLLVTNPEMVVAVDVSEIQLYLVELKKAAITHLEYEEVLAFLGFKASSKRSETFNNLKEHLSSKAIQYWEKHIDQIKDGVINQGKFEKYFQLFSRKILPFIHTKKTAERLLNPKSEAEQVLFYNKKWNTFRWRMLFKIFFSKYIMGKFGRDPEFLKEVEVNVGSHIFEKAAHQLKSQAAQDNFILRYNLTGNFGDLLPHYLQPAHFKIIKKNINRLHIKQGFAEDAINQYGEFDYMNLSNIFEYMDREQFHIVSENLVSGLKEGGKMAYWNLMVPRRMSKLFKELEYQETTSKEMTAKDKGFFYNQFIVDQLV